MSYPVLPDRSSALWHQSEISAALTFQGASYDLPNQCRSKRRMSLPAELRNRLGLSDGGALLVEETSDGLILRTVAHAQALARKYTAEKPQASVDAFLAA